MAEFFTILKIEDWTIPLSSLILGAFILAFAALNFKKTADRDSVLLLISNYQTLQGELNRTKDDLKSAQGEIRDLYSKWEECEADKIALREDNERLMRQVLNLPQRPEPPQRPQSRRRNSTEDK